jgi:hypothetical protein
MGLKFARSFGVTEETFLGKTYFGVAKRPLNNLKDLYLSNTRRYIKICGFIPNIKLLGIKMIFCL